ncbi:choice-of-anchor I family protein [Paenibacillus agricola]|uniref:S-layer family protein n=1 Tax=Paenibacillus agricola TaxID=2716264 RepID=A0ABX0IZK4_9BACL|nr:choice-of-anchor I family protein [Paenibacillus agricola]NHN29312.1 hypothetical protein [Paenibacillus agricola]
MKNSFKKKFRRFIGILLAAELLASLFLAGGAIASTPVPDPGTPNSAEGSYDVSVPHVMINQVFGTGAADPSVLVSHSFIELYNPTNQAVNLNGWSLHYAGQSNKTGPAGNWQQLNLTGTIPAHSSYLITGDATTATNPKIDLTGKANQTITGHLLNKGMMVVLTSNTGSIDNLYATTPSNNLFTNKPQGYVDMLGTGSNDSGSTINSYETAFPTGSDEGTSKKKSVRRKSFTDTDNNKADFTQFDIEMASTSDIQLKKPRGSVDGPWGQTMGIATTSLDSARVGTAYNVTLSVYGGTAPYTFTASGLANGLSIGTTTGAMYGTPAAGTEGNHSVTVTVTDSVYSTANVSLTLNVQAALVAEPVIPDIFSVTKIGSYQAAAPNSDGGVAEIVKYNKDNGKFYLVNGASNPPTLDIVNLSGAAPVKETSVQVKTLAETNGFLYGDLTSVDVNTTTKHVSVSVQELDHMKIGKILVLDYAGNLLKEYPAGVQPDMIKSSIDGRYLLTANEAEPRLDGQDPEGSVTIVDTTNDSVVHLKFDNPAIIDDTVYIRGASSAGKIAGKGTKADAVYDLEPEYITIIDDQNKAYVSLQENNSIATIDLNSKTITSVKGLGMKDYSLPGNSLDLQKDNKVLLENVPFKGIYMPDGITSATLNGTSYLLSANEGDATEWPGKNNASSIGQLKGSLAPGSDAAVFLASKNAYDSVEAITGWGNDNIYLYGSRSFSIWNTATMAQVYDSGNAFEKITGQRYPANFNASNNNVTLDNRSTKKGPEPEDVKVGKAGNKTIAFIGLERVGGVMMYDISNPEQPIFVNYTNTRDFTAGLNTDTGPEGLDFIPAELSPTKLPLLLVANEVGGTVSVLQLNVTKVTLDQTTLSLTARRASQMLTATVVPFGEGASTVTWTSSNTDVATVDVNGTVTPVTAGTAVIRAVSADGYGSAEANVTVAALNSSNSNSAPSTSATPNDPIQSAPVVGTDNNEVKGTISAKVETDAQGNVKATITAEQVTEVLKSLEQVGQANKVIEIKVGVAATAKQAVIELPGSVFSQLASSNVAELTLSTGIGTLSFDHSAILTVSQSALDQPVSVSINRTSADEVTARLPAASREALAAAIQDRPIFDFTVSVGDKKISDFGGGNVQINVPYQPKTDENPNAIVIYYVSDSGQLETISNAWYDQATGLITFSVKHFSLYAVGYYKVEFKDTTTSFAQQQIIYLAARNIINGVSDQSFAPEQPITRADFALILARIAGADLGKPSSTRFKDVAADQYYAAAVEWSAAQGIVNGVADGQFDPQARITRDQVVTMIVRLADSLKFTLPATMIPTPFADQSSIPAYALMAAQAAQQAGIVSGKSSEGKADVYFAPADSATREEAAKMLATFMQQLK